MAVDRNSTNTSVASHASLLSVRGLTRRFGGLTAVDDIDLDLAKGELVSIIGPNGAGKTTFFNCLTGLYQPTAAVTVPIIAQKERIRCAEITCRWSSSWKTTSSKT